MKVKFVNGVTKECSSPTEIKSFYNNSDSHWVLNVKLIGAMTSAELDALLTTENISRLEFLTTATDEGDQAIFTLDGYERVTSSAIRHAEDTTATIVEIQMSKGA